MTKSPPFLTINQSLSVVPMLRGRIAFANEVRRSIYAINPDCIVVEFPRALKEPFCDLLAHLPKVGMLAYRTAEGRALFLSNDPGDAAVEACRLAIARRNVLEFVDTCEGECDGEGLLLPDPEVVAHIGCELYAEACLSALRERPPTERELTVARRILVLAERHHQILLVLSFPTVAALRRLLEEGVPQGKLETEDEPREWKMQFPDRDHLGHLVLEMPDTLARLENWRGIHGIDEGFPTRGARTALLRSAAHRYERQFNRRLSRTEWRTLLQYLRNLSLVKNSLVPDFESLVTAAKGCIDDDFGALVFQQAWRYPANDDPEDEADEATEFEESSPEEPGVSHSRPKHRSLTLYGDFSDGTARLDPTYPLGKMGEISFTFKRRQLSASEIASVWKRIRRRGGFMSNGICSWPPEDQRIEAFLQSVRARALEKLGENNRSSEEFATSFLDGIDIRETVRRWDRKRIWVRREQTPRGRIGPVVLLWEDGPWMHPGLWPTTLYAENQNESDISIVCTPRPGKDIVGPGISRLKYQALLSIYPSRHIPDIWGEPSFLAHWSTYGRALIAAAILMADTPHIAVVSALAIDADLKKLAHALKVNIIHLSPSGFSSAVLERVRTLHILADKDIRRWAGHYIPK
jgi:hypothetical protein